MLWEIKTLNQSVQGFLNIFGSNFLFIYFIFVLLCMFCIFVFNRWQWRIPPCPLTRYEFYKQSSLLSKRCTCIFRLFSIIGRIERESLKSGTNTHISALINWIVKVPSWWWIPRWSRAASLKKNLCSTLNATPKWLNSNNASPNHSYFVKRRHTTRSHPRRVSENLNVDGTMKILFTSLSIKFSKGEFKKFWKENCISF